MDIGILVNDSVGVPSLLALLAGETRKTFGFLCERSFKRQTETGKFGLVLIDSAVPGAEDVMRWVRGTVGWALPMIAVSTDPREEAVVAALQAGADDYIANATRPGEFLARIGAVLRRAAIIHRPSLRLADYVLDIELQRAMLGDRVIHLSQREFAFAALFFENEGQILSRETLQACPIGRQASNRAIDATVSRLRRSLVLDGSQGVKLTAVYGAGYRLSKTV